MEDFKFSLKGKKYSFEVKKCRNIFSRASGLMLRKNSKPLLFIFSGENTQSIHSFFCVNFIAIWFNKNEVIDIKLVRPWRVSVKPFRKFDKLLEIPENDENFENFVDLLKDY